MHTLTHMPLQGRGEENGTGKKKEKQPPPYTEAVKYAPPSGIRGTLGTQS